MQQLPQLDDHQIELAIAGARRELIAAYQGGDRNTARLHARTISELVAMRSPRRVAQMERERGLR